MHAADRFLKDHPQNGEQDNGSSPMSSDVRGEEQDSIRKTAADRYLDEQKDEQTEGQSPQKENETIGSGSTEEKKCSPGRYVLAAVVCSAVWLLILCAGAVLFGWKHGGGYVMLAISFGIVVVIWRAITRAN